MARNLPREAVREELVRTICSLVEDLEPTDVADEDEFREAYGVDSDALITALDGLRRMADLPPNLATKAEVQSAKTVGNILDLLMVLQERAAAGMTSAPGAESAPTDSEPASMVLTEDGAGTVQDLVFESEPVPTVEPTPTASKERVLVGSVAE